ncbi:hypothetical protein EDB83DRAFT_1628485 [Lactarius deliciosus]|nr:hypothetical protein EDB83DRAFT_1628485 [Lactarius deliciosus]
MPRLLLALLNPSLHTTGCEAAGQRICITQEYGISGIGRDWPSYFSHKRVFWPCCGQRQSRVGGVLTMYEKSGAKNAKHSWTSSTTSIGALSYLAGRCYQHIRQCQFQTMECMATRTMRFAHLPSLAFLCIAPPSMVRRFIASHFLELLSGPFENIFQGVNSDSQAVLMAVKGLMRPSRRDRVVEGNAIDDADD